MCEVKPCKQDRFMSVRSRQGEAWSQSAPLFSGESEIPIGDFTGMARDYHYSAQFLVV